LKGVIVEDSQHVVAAVATLHELAAEGSYYSCVLVQHSTPVTHSPTTKTLIPQRQRLIFYSSCCWCFVVVVVVVVETLPVLPSDTKMPPQDDFAAAAAAPLRHYYHKPHHGDVEDTGQAKIFAEEAAVAEIARFG